MVDISKSEVLQNLKKTEMRAEDYRRNFSKKANEFEQECLKKRIPFCMKCAWIDFDDAVVGIRTEAERQLGYGPHNHIPEDVLCKINEIQNLYKSVDFEKYTKDWLLGGIQEERELRTGPTGEKFDIVSGYHLNYKCPKFKHKNSMWVDKATYDRLEKEGKLNVDGK